MFSISGTTLLGVTKNTSGLWIFVQAPIADMTLDVTAGLYAPGCLILNVGSGLLYRNLGTTAAPSWQVTSVASSVTGLGELGIARAKYSFAVDGGAISTITPVSNALLPDDAVIIGGTINSTTAAVGATATIAVGTSAGSSTTSLLGATAVASFSADARINSVATFAAPVKLTAAGNITLTIATAALTAGVIEVTVLYYVAAA